MTEQEVFICQVSFEDTEKSLSEISKKPIKRLILIWDEESPHITAQEMAVFIEKSSISQWNLCDCKLVGQVIELVMILAHSEMIRCLEWTAQKQKMEYFLMFTLGGNW